MDLCIMHIGHYITSESKKNSSFNIIKMNIFTKTLNEKTLFQYTCMLMFFVRSRVRNLEENRSFFLYHKKITLTKISTASQILSKILLFLNMK